MKNVAPSVPRLSLLLAAAVLIPFASRGSRVMADREVTVGDGDTLTAIALMYFGDAAYAPQIAAYNHLTDADTLAQGQVLKLPDAGPGGPGTLAPIAALAAPVASASVLHPPDIPPAPLVGPVIQTGLATWYGPGFEGNRTKCGQIFHASDLTASSNDLPCGTVIQVSNVRTGTSIVVTVDDTGGFQHPNILDLSRAAFDRLASADGGVIEVSISRVLS
jgi:rare lipoprotein A